jgi:hypothetical protein
MAERTYPRIKITAEMLAEAERLGPSVKVDRTQASPIDTLAGILGEFAFAEYFFGDWRRHSVGNNKGQVDFGNVEVKASAFPFRDTLNLLVREDYAQRRAPTAYVQVIINVKSGSVDVPAGTEVVMGGWEQSAVVHNAPLRDFGSKGGGHGGYRCHHIAIRDLRPIDTLRAFLDGGK